MRRIAALAALALVVLTGCGSNNFRDVEGVNSEKADSYRVISNVDGHPNLTVVCVDGVAFVTTTRDYNALTVVPALDHTCPAS